MKTFNRSFFFLIVALAVLAIALTSCAAANAAVSAPANAVNAAADLYSQQVLILESDFTEIRKAENAYSISYKNMTEFLSLSNTGGRDLVAEVDICVSKALAGKLTTPYNSAESAAVALQNAKNLGSTPSTGQEVNAFVNALGLGQGTTYPDVVAKQCLGPIQTLAQYTVDNRDKNFSQIKIFNTNAEVLKNLYKSTAKMAAVNKFLNDYGPGVASGIDDAQREATRILVGKTNPNWEPIPTTFIGFPSDMVYVEGVRNMDICNKYYSMFIYDGKNVGTKPTNILYPNPAFYLTTIDTALNNCTLYRVPAYSYTSQSLLDPTSAAQFDYGTNTGMFGPTSTPIAK